MAKRSKSGVTPPLGGSTVPAGVGTSEKPPEQGSNGCSTARSFRNLQEAPGPTSSILRALSQALPPQHLSLPGWLLSANTPCAHSCRSATLLRDLSALHNLPGAAGTPQNPRRSSRQRRCPPLLVSPKLSPHTPCVTVTEPAEDRTTRRRKLELITCGLFGRARASCRRCCSAAPRLLRGLGLL